MKTALRMSPVAVALLIPVLQRNAVLEKGA